MAELATVGVRILTGPIVLLGWWCLACEVETWNPEGNGPRAVCRECNAPKRAEVMQ